jgi:magnesium chelatase subunit D
MNVFERGFTYPFAALAGQDLMVSTLLALAVDPGLGGVLLVGEKGTAKSTAVRAMAELLPELVAVRRCHYRCAPDRPGDYCPDCQKRARAGSILDTAFVPTPLLTLPLGATEDRVAGGLDLEASTRRGRAVLAPGLLGLANRGFLYVDEVNLLDPHLAHLLLDAVESGRLCVEREGLSLWHPSRAALIGTMNPEEGSLGPQLADRFALTVRVAGETDPAMRAEIVRRRMAFEADPDGFRREWAGETERLAGRVREARRMLNRVSVTDEARALIAEIVREHRPRGHRADLALTKAARARAAWEGLAKAGPKQVAWAADLAIEFRRRPLRPKKVEVQAVRGDSQSSDRHYEQRYVIQSRFEEPPESSGHEAGDGPLVERLFSANDRFEIVTPTDRREKGPRASTGRRTARSSAEARGRYYRSSPHRLGRPLALDATLRAAAPHQNARRGSNGRCFVIKDPDVREKVFRKKTGRLVLFVVDASGSVGSLERMSEAKAAALALLSEAYQKRDRVGLISFHDRKAEVLLPPTGSVEMASRLLEDMPTGGKTPMAAALVDTHKLVRTELARDPGLTPLIVIMTDGRPNVPLDPAEDAWREVLHLAKLLARDRRLKFLLVDTDRGYYNDYKLTRDLAESLGAPRLTLEDLRAGRLQAWLDRAV